MGSCANRIAQQEERIDKEIQSELYSDRSTAHKIKKLLLLGPSGSGKSTIHKQLRSLYGNGYTDPELSEFKEEIFIQTLNAIHQCIKHWQIVLYQKCKDEILQTLQTNGRLAYKVRYSLKYLNTMTGTGISSGGLMGALLITGWFRMQSVSIPQSLVLSIADWWATDWYFVSS